MGKKKEKPGREDMRDGRTGRQWNFKKKSRERGMANRIFKVKNSSESSLKKFATTQSDAKATGRLLEFLAHYLCLCFGLPQ